MNYAEWTLTVRSVTVNDPIWKLEVYRLSLFAGDIGWYEFLKLSNEKLMYGIADQLHRSPNSISVNLTEGYSRSKGLDRARFIEASLGSARESREWYYKSRYVLRADFIDHRMGLSTHIIGMLTPMILHQRKNAIREEQAEYIVSPSSTLNIDSEVPMP